MYKSTILCITIVAIVAARNIDEDTFHLPPELVLKVNKYILSCTEKHNADPDVFRKLLVGTMSNDDSSKNWLLCFGVTGKLTDEDGHFNVTAMSAMVGDHKKLKEFTQALIDCNKITKENPLETVYEMNVCIHEKSPFKFSL